MEIYSNTTRFALACNQSSKIIEPIQSRCAIVRYSRLSDQEVLERLLVVAREEKVRSTRAAWAARPAAEALPSPGHCFGMRNDALVATVEAGCARRTATCGLSGWSRDVQ